MALKKACCCLSLRAGSLLILTFFLITNLWSMLKLLTTWGDPLYRAFLKSNDYFLFYPDMSFALIGSLIFLAAILSITNNSSTKSLFNAVMSFLILDLIYYSYKTYIYTSNGVFKYIYFTEMEIQARNYHENLRDEFRTEMKQFYPTALAIIYAVLAIYALIVLYFVLILRSYLAEVKENHVGYTLDQINAKNTEAKLKFPDASPNDVKFTVPQHFNQPPKYSV